MDEERFNIYFAGEVLDGFDAAAVRRGLGALFNVRDDTLDKLFSGATQLLRRGCDRDEALRYKAAMERVGARPRITRNRDRQATDLSLAAIGADVLAPQERRAPAAAAVAPGSYTLAEAGARLAEARAAPPPAPDVSHLSVAEAGERLAPEPGPQPSAPAVDAAWAIDDSEAPAPAPAPAAVQAPALDVAEAGADVLEAAYRGGHRPAPPPTDHLELDP